MTSVLSDGMQGNQKVDAMTVIRGHFGGRHVILDEPAPPDMAANTPVTVVFNSQEAGDVLAQIAQLSTTGKMPPDFSEQHEHYVKGLPRR